jgi:hypothetical protein
MAAASALAGRGHRSGRPGIAADQALLTRACMSDEPRASAGAIRGRQ